MPFVEVHHNAAAQRFEAFVAGLLCRADYRLADNVMVLHHTEVPPPLQGRGIAGVLVRAALDYARAQHLQVAPHCSYVCAYMRRHPETRDLLAA